MRVEAYCRMGVRRLSAERSAVLLGAALVDVKSQFLLGGLSTLARAVYNILPSAYVDAVVRCWGNKLTTVDALRNMGTRILFNRLGDVTQSLHSISVDEVYDWTARFVELRWHIDMGGVVGAIDVLNLKKLAEQPPNLNNLPNPNNLKDFVRVRDDSTVENNGDGKAPAFGPAGFKILDAQLNQRKAGRGLRTLMQNGQVVGEDANKGTYFGAVVAQLFSDSSSNPPLPPFMPSVMNLDTTAY
jgi:hypothetical protein